jgi:hypothetical protein
VRRLANGGPVIVPAIIRLLREEHRDFNVLSSLLDLLATSDVDVVAQVREAQVPMLSMKRKNLPMALTSAVHRALEKDPARRFRTAREMLEALTDVLRVLPDSTDAMALGRSVREAQGRLAGEG